MSEQASKPSFIKTTLFGKCPRCGTGSLYQSFLKIADHCPDCDLDFSFADTGDGPAVFVIMIVGFIATGGVLYTEFSYQPPLWLLIAIWGPLTCLLSILGLYWSKGALFAQQYATNAQQGQTMERKASNGEGAQE